MFGNNLFIYFLVFIGTIAVHFVAAHNVSTLTTGLVILKRVVIEDNDYNLVRYFYGCERCYSVLKVAGSNTEKLACAENIHDIYEENSKLVILAEGYLNGEYQEYTIVHDPL